MSFKMKRQPKKNLKHVGVELEFDLPSRAHYDALIVDLKAGPLKHCLEVDYEHISWDAPYAAQYGYEAALLVSERQFSTRIKQMIELIQRHGGFVDERCGLHVHLDCRTRDRRAVCDRLFTLQERLYSLVNARRKLNPECKPVTKGRYDWKGQGFWIADKYPTVEVRMMESSFDVKRIIDWIKLLVGVAQSVDVKASEAA